MASTFFYKRKTASIIFVNGRLPNICQPQIANSRRLFNMNVCVCGVRCPKCCTITKKVIATSDGAMLVPGSWTVASKQWDIYAHSIQCRVYPTGIAIWGRLVPPTGGTKA